MIRLIPAALVLSLAWSLPVRAEDTLLRLAETATVMVTPDELAASLRAEATAPTAQEAQRRVNEIMKDALATAKKTEGVTVSTGGYSVWRNGQTPRGTAESWQAGAAINLSATDGDGLLRLVGDLQQKGLAAGNLGWRLSRKTERKARDDATRQALAALRGRADDAAAILGLRFEAFREVRLDHVTPPTALPRMMATRSAMSAVAQPPAAEAEDQPVSAQAEADIVLKAR